MAGEDNEVYVFADAERARELRRLALMGEEYDIYSQSRLTALGLGSGATCLEAGVGAGSMARWMASQVGPGGKVIGVDLDGRLLSAADRVAIEFRQGDILEVELDEASFDFIHARLLLQHIAGTPSLLQRFYRWLKPGDWVVLAEVDYTFPLRTSGNGQLYQRLTDAMAELVNNHGGGAGLGTGLAPLLAAAGFASIGGAGSFPLVIAGGNQPELLALNAQTVRAALNLQEITDEQYEQLEIGLRSGEAVQTAHGMFVVCAQRPMF